MTIDYTVGKRVINFKKLIKIYIELVEMSIFGYCTTLANFVPPPFPTAGGGSGWIYQIINLNPTL